MQKTAYEMRMRDWSSDVCSSDLVPVSVVKVEPTRTEIFDELPARVDALEDAEIRARVTGIVTGIDFEQGGFVKDGQQLFTIDPAPYVAARDQAAAPLQQEQADVRSTSALAKRYAKLVKTNAVSRQEYDDAVAQAAQAQVAEIGRAHDCTPVTNAHLRLR